MPEVSNIKMRYLNLKLSFAISIVNFRTCMSGSFLKLGTAKIGLVFTFMNHKIFMVWCIVNCPLLSSLRYRTLVIHTHLLCTILRENVSNLHWYAHYRLVYSHLECFIRDGDTDPQCEKGKRLSSVKLTKSLINKVSRPIKLHLFSFAREEKHFRSFDSKMGTTFGAIETS